MDLDTKRDIETIANDYKAKYPQFSSQIEDFKCVLTKNEEFLKKNTWVASTFEKSLKKAMVSKSPRKQLSKDLRAMTYVVKRIDSTSSTSIIILIGVCLFINAIFFFILKPVIILDDIWYSLIGIVIGVVAFFLRNINFSITYFLCALAVSTIGIYDAISKLMSGPSPSLILYLCGTFFLLSVTLRQIGAIKKRI
jgi:hypothetical protein